MEQESDQWAEIDVMKTIGEALANLDEPARERVLKWTSHKFGFSHAAESRPTAARSNRDSALAVPDVEQPNASGDLATFFSSASPTTQSEKALIVGYWFQVVQGQADLDSQQINTELKNLGHGIGNITRAFDDLIRNRPQIVIQTRKSGTAKQARKKYRLTAEGIARVKQMITRSSAANGESEVV